MADRARSSDPAVSASTERRLVVGALAAELGHDLQGPVNLLRMSLERLTRGDSLDQEDLSLLGEELERLGQLNTRLRSLARAPGLQKIACSPRHVVELALGQAPLAGFTVDATDSVTIACDKALLAQALKELVANALQARKDRAGVRFEQGAAPGFCVWDDGSGFEVELGVDAALAWGATKRPSAAGLGLTVALRAARAHGFNLELRRAPPFTEAWLLVPERELKRQAAP